MPLVYYFIASKGLDDSNVELPTEAKSISWETTFDQETRDSKLVETTLRYLNERIGNKLREKNRKARCITPKVRSTDFSTTTRHRTLGQATDTGQMMSATELELLKNE